MMARISIPVEAGNRAVSDGSIGSLVQSTAERWKPEAMYFTSFEAKRTAYVFFDLPDSSDIPAFAEPFFTGLDAELEFLPVMNAEDLQAGLSRL